MHPNRNPITNPQHNKQSSKTCHYAYTSDSDLEDTESSGDNSSSVQDTYTKSKVKLPPFTEETAERKRWSKNLDE